MILQKLKTHLPALRRPAFVFILVMALIYAVLNRYSITVSGHMIYRRYRWTGTTESSFHGGEWERVREN